MADEDEEDDFCDCAEEYERSLRIQKALGPLGRFFGYSTDSDDSGASSLHDSLRGSRFPPRRAFGQGRVGIHGHTNAKFGSGHTGYRSAQEGHDERGAFVIERGVPLPSPPPLHGRFYPDHGGDAGGPVRRATGAGASVPFNLTTFLSSGLVFFGGLGLLCKWFGIGEKLKEFTNMYTKDVMELLNEPTGRKGKNASSSYDNNKPPTRIFSDKWAHEDDDAASSFSWKSPGGFKIPGMHANPTDGACGQIDNDEEGVFIP